MPLAPALVCTGSGTTRAIRLQLLHHADEAMYIAKRHSKEPRDAPGPVKADTRVWGIETTLLMGPIETVEHCCLTDGAVSADWMVVLNPSSDTLETRLAQPSEITIFCLVFDHRYDY